MFLPFIKTAFLHPGRVLDSKNHWTLALIILCVSLAVKTAPLLIVGNGEARTIWGQQHGDVRRYVAQAGTFFDGRPDLNVGGYSGRHGPVYPAFVALVWRVFGRDNYNAVRMVQLVLNHLAALMLYGLARRMAGQEAANYILGAALLWFAYFYWSAEILTESLFTFFLVATLYTLHHSLRWRGSLTVAGVTMALASQTRMTMLVLVPFLVVWSFAVHRRRNWRAGAVALALLLASFLACFLPLNGAFEREGYVDYMMRPEFMGKVYTGSEGAVGPPPAISLDRPRLERELFYAGLLWERIQTPAYWHHLVFWKILGFWYPLLNANNGAFYLLDYSLFFFAPFVFLALWKMPRNAGYWLLLSTLVATYLIVIVFIYGHVRMRCPADPALTVFGGYGLHLYMKTYWPRPGMRYLLLSHAGLSVAAAVLTDHFVELLRHVVAFG